jgi:hypothetical protein
MSEHRLSIKRWVLTTAASSLAPPAPSMPVRWVWTRASAEFGEGQRLGYWEA